MSVESAACPAPDDLRASNRPPVGGVPELFGPGSPWWDLAGNTLVLTTIATPLIMQTMHPMIGAAVDKYSVFRTDPYGRGIRSLDSIMLWIYGGPAATEEGNRLRRLHKDIKGVDEHGRRYSALNPEAYTWVHGTAFAWIIASYPLFYGRPPTDAEKHELYQGFLQLGHILQVPPKLLPPTQEAYWEYYHDMIRTQLENHSIAEYIITDLLIGPPPPPGLPRVLHPLWQPIGKFAGRLAWLATVGIMPPEVRDILKQRWTRAHDRRLRILFAIIRQVHRRLPERLRYLPLAVHARRHARSLDAIHRRALTSFVGGH